MVGWNIFLILAAVIPYAGRILSAPTIAYGITTTSPHASNYVNPIWSPESRLPTTRATTRAETLRLIVSAVRSRDDYIVSENEYQQVLDRLRKEAEFQSAAPDSGNYVDDDVSMADILRRINQPGSITSTLPIRTGGTNSSIPRLVADNIGDGTAEPYEAMDMGTQTVEEGASNLLTSQDLDDDDQREMIHGHPGLSQHDECSICFDSMVESAVDPDSHVKTLPCGHKFHMKCLRRWKSECYRWAAKCPMCRGDLSL